MKERLTKKENVLIATMLFGLFFGAGNLIFPAYMGQLAGKNMWQAIIGFVITGVGLPLLGIAAMGISRSDGLMELSAKVSRPYSYFFTCALYLTIGPFFAIPRCATTPFTVAVATLMPEGSNQSLALAIFSFVFFAIVLAFSLKPGKILTHVGKILTPIFLVLLAVLVIAALVNPTAAISTLEAQGTYESNAFFTGFLEGYNTMDALASLACGMTRMQGFWHIVFPQAVRVAVPGLSNNFVDIIKQSSLAFTLGVTEIMAVARMEGSTNLKFLESFTAVMVVYWLIVTFFNYLQKLLEKWLSRMY